MSGFSIKLEDAKWTVRIDPTIGYGYFENNNGEQGGLWFEDNRLIEYDGVDMFELPKSVFNMLVGAGYDLSGIECCWRCCCQ